MASTGRGRRVLHLLKDPGRLLGTILLGNTFVNVAASSVAAAITAEILPGSLGMGIGVLIMTFLLLIVGEITPKTIARSNNRRWAEAVSPVMTLLLKTLSPAALVLKYPADRLDRLLPGRNNPGGYRTAELNILMELAREEGFLGAEADTASAILELDRRNCVSAMVPREEVVSMQSDWSLERMTMEARSTTHTVYPFVDSRTGRMSGVVDVRDLLGAGEFLVREVPFFPETARLISVFKSIRESNSSIGAVVDEYGDWTGIISVTDILERAVFAGAPGDFLPEGVTRSGNDYVVPANLPVDVLSVLLSDSGLSSRYAESCGGLLQELTGRIPGKDEEIMHMGYSFRILERSGNALKKILIRPPEDT